MAKGFSQWQKRQDKFDDSMDAKKGIKEGSPKDLAIDKAKGIPEDDAPKGKKGGKHIIGW